MFFLAYLLAIPLVQGGLVRQPRDDHEHNSVGSLPSSIWYHPNDHPVRALFKRGGEDDTEDFPAVGSPTWSSPYPQSSPDVSALPVEWIKALNAAVAAGKIPNIPRSSNTPPDSPTYPEGVNPQSPDVCSSTYKCKHANDIWDAPAGVVALSFDDGPQPFTTSLVQFLDSHNTTATHFMIGTNVLAYPQLFLTAFQSGHDIAVHTWTHPYMTTLSNEEIVGQLGWTMQLLYYSTGGRVAKFWRPPYGDSDNRVRAIAKEVFGLQTVIWNQDTLDWAIETGNPTAQTVQDNMRKWLTGPKDPGLVILEHETSDFTVQAFVQAYPLIAENGWRLVSLAEMTPDGAYQNAATSISNVLHDGILAIDTPVASPASTEALPTSTESSEPEITTTSNNLGSSAQTTDNSASSLVRRQANFWTISAFIGAVTIAFI